MKTFFAIVLFLAFQSQETFSQSHQDSILVDKEKVESIVKKLKKNKQIVVKDVQYSFPSKINKGEVLALSVIQNGAVILIYDIDTETYEIGTVTDLR